MAPVGGREWRVTDEIHHYRRNPRGRVEVIATVDERDYPGGTLGRDHPIARYHRVDAGRAWHTAWDTTRCCTRTAFSCAISKVACAM